MPSRGRLRRRVRLPFSARPEARLSQAQGGEELQDCGFREFTNEGRVEPIEPSQGFPQGCREGLPGFVLGQKGEQQGVTSVLS